jgi:hypothetical protein
VNREEVTERCLVEQEGERGRRNNVVKGGNNGRNRKRESGRGRETDVKTVWAQRER